tara:strand:- start:355 stop:810 length:456 start_codon:yes stop_codon:yes gene_type:complete
VKIKYLGQQSTPKLDSYSPDFLDSIPRNNQHLNQFFGLDYWNAYEFSYLNSRNLPVIEALEIKISMHSALTVESKSLKLYLASFYNKKFNDSAKAHKLIEKDLRNFYIHQFLLKKQIDLMLLLAPLLFQDLKIKCQRIRLYTSKVLDLYAL